MSKNYIKFTVLGLYLCSSYAQLTYESEPQWDVLIFTQQWPVTVCKVWTDHNPSHKCSMPNKPDTWTIHGIWPTKLGTMGPEFCNSSWHFDPEVIRPIESPLSQMWINVEAGDSIYSFWAHEWTKHGTCAAVLEPLNSELKYFSQGLHWISNFSMTDILEEAGIVPSNDKSYPLSKIHDAIKNKLNINPVSECRHEDGKSWLVELRICFDKQFKLVDCDGVLKCQPKIYLESEDYTLKSILTNCDITKEVVYPETDPPPNFLLVELYRLFSWLQWFTL